MSNHTYISPSATCRLCGVMEDAGSMVKYGVRHHAQGALDAGVTGEPAQGQGGAVPRLLLLQQGVEQRELGLGPRIAPEQRRVVDMRDTGHGL